MTTKPMTVHGADLSHHQTTLNLHRAKDLGLRWVYHKATEGNTITDGMYESRRKDAKEAGLPFGAYHFAQPAHGTGATQARRFLEVAKPMPGDLRPALDLEVMNGMRMDQIALWAGAFCDEINAQLGVQPVVYTNFDLHLAKTIIVWRARYNDDNRPPVLPWDIWQFSNGILGVPDSFPGLGHVDLNTMAPRLTVAEMLIPKPRPEPHSTRVHLMHAPLEYKDSPAQHTHDLERIFARARARGVKIISGTEAGPGSNNTPDELIRIGTAAGFRMWVPSAAKIPTDCWVGVHEDFIKGGWTKDYHPVIPPSDDLYKKIGVDPHGKPRWGEKGVAWASWDSPLGPWTHGAVHHLTKSRRENETHAGINHWEWNRALEEYVGVWANLHGRGASIVTLAGDSNMNDKTLDIMFSNGMTTLADELEKWPDTGHGPIDFIATRNKDGRVRAAYWRALDDQTFPLNVDHFLCEGGVDVRHLK